MTPWSGHLPITCFALFSILERAATEETDFSRDERALFTVSEFWAAVSACELLTHLGSQPADRLRSAGIALTSVGAEFLAKAVFAAVDELRWMNSRVSYRNYIERLEQRLQMADDSVDVLIGRMAQRVIAVSMPMQHAAVEAHAR